MNTRQMVALARWLLGPGAKGTSVRWMVRQWRARPGAAARWAEVRAREEVRR